MSPRVLRVGVPAVAAGAGVGVAIAVAVALSAAPSCRRPRDEARPALLVPVAAPPPAEVFEPSPLAPGERLPLLIVLHGLGDSGTNLFRRMDLQRFGRAHRVVVVAPDGTLDRTGRRFWNAGAACCNVDHVPVDDVARLAALIDAWRARPSVDPRRVYVMGLSNGGFMAHRLACAIGERLAAVASISGAGPGPDVACAASSPIAVLEIHGDADAIVRYQGGRVFDDPALAPHPSAQATMRAWAGRLGCGAGPPAQTITASHRADGYAGCARGGAELWTISGWDHSLPSPAIVDEIWSYLARWIKPAA